MILPLLLATAALLPLPSAAAQENQDRAVPAKDVQRAGKSGVAKFALAQEPASWDPLASDATANQVIQRQVYECLFEYKPQSNPIELQPLLAESWQIQAGGLEWIIQLRQDASFFDPFDPPLWPERRRNVTAQDVLYSWLRMADGRNNGNGFWTMQGLFPGLDEFHAQTRKSNPKAEEVWQRGLAQGVAGIQVVDTYKLKLRLHRPDPSLMVRLASPYYVIYPHEAVERDGKEFLNKPVGSGPYHLTHWIPNHQAFLNHTPGWRGQAHPGNAAFPAGWQIPQIKGLEFTAVLDASTRALQFERGEIDRITPLQATFNQWVIDDQPAPELKQRGVTLAKVPPAGLSMIAFNMDDADLGWIPGDDEGNQKRKLLRQAIALAYPYQQWHKVIRSGSWAKQAVSFLPQGLPTTHTLPACDYVQTDVNRARQLLAQAGWPNGQGAPKLRYELGGNTPVDVATGDIFKQGMKQIGLEVTVVTNSWGELRAKMNRREAQIFSRGWSMDWPDAENILGLFYGPNQSPDVNRSNFQNQDYDNLYRRLLLASGDERTAVVQSMLELLNEELPAIPVDHRIGYLLIQPRLKGVDIHPFDPFACKYYRLER